MRKIIFKDFVLALTLTFILYFYLKYWLFINENILPYLLGVFFVVIFVFSSTMSFYMFRLKEKLETLSIQLDKIRRIDEVSSVFRRNYLLDLLSKYVFLAKEEKMPLSVLLIDVDSFKEINKFYGQKVGDLVLKELTELIKEELNNSDLIGRYGGDEFLIITFSSIKNAYELASCINEKVKKHLFQNTFSVSLSIGICELRYDDDFEKLLKRAEEALFLAKHKGGNRVDYLEHFLLFE